MGMFVSLNSPTCLYESARQLTKIQDKLVQTLGMVLNN